MGEPIPDGVNGTASLPPRAAAHINEPIAIVGAACRLAGGVTSLPGLWDMMKESRTGHSRVPAKRWNADAWYHPDPDRKGGLTSKSAFFLEEDVAAFDAPFFSVTAKEAAGMDPAKRLLLEVVYESLESAGMPIERVAGTSTGVYVGCMTSDYEMLSTKDAYDLPHMAAAGSSEAMTANRVSWFFDFRGPSLTLDTACSSSLYALHLACQSLRLGETDMNIVSGVNVILDPNTMSQLTAMHMLSPDGTSHSFDDRANGYGRGEGIGALVVKRLSDAVRDGDVVRAVIRASAVNVDGKTPSVTMPSSDAQAELIRTAYKEAGLALTDTQYVELHGTGTPVGDPIELSAIAATFGASAKPGSPIYVGSIKPNVGHTEGCAGIAGVFKAMLALEQGMIPPTASVERVNPKLTFDAWNLALPPTTIPWPTTGPRRVSVNSFGFGGANAHVILDDAYHYMRDRGVDGRHSTVTDLRQPPAATNGFHDGSLDPHAHKRLFVFSTRDQQGLQRLAEAWKGHAVNASPADVAHTLATKRSLFDHRAIAVADSLPQLSAQLASGLDKFRRPASKSNGVVFVFTGQGAQWAGMGKELLALPVFARSIAQSNAALASLGCAWDLAEELQKVQGSRIDAPDYSQPLCTAVQIGLVDLLRHWSVEPKAVIGHSSGEMAAAYAAGITTHDDTIKAAYLRGVYSAKVAQSPERNGAMLAAGISEDEAHGYLKGAYEGRVVTACMNSPKSVTLSGDADAVSELELKISSDGKFARKLRVTTAYHSPHMQDVAEGCLAAMKQAGLAAPRQTAVRMFSSVTGDEIDHAEIVPEYWIRNMCQPVRFSGAMTNLLTYVPNRRSARRIPYKWNSVVEIGPHSALKAPLTQIMEGVEKKLPAEIPYTSLLVRGADAVVTALKAAGTLWALGNAVALARVNREDELSAPPTPVVNLPAYPWNHEKTYWHETRATSSERLKSLPRSDLLGVPVDDNNPFEPQWKNSLRLSENPWMEDHAITGTTLYPGAGMLIMVIEAVQQMAPSDRRIRGIEFNNVHFDRGLVIPSEGHVETRLSIKVPTEGLELQHEFAVFSALRDGPWTKHCFGSFTVLYHEEEEYSIGEDPAALEWKQRLDEFAAIKRLPARDVDVERFYKDLEAVGMGYGDTFRNVTQLAIASDEPVCYGTVKIPDTQSVMPQEFEFQHIIHPATLDAIFHLMVAAVSDGASWREAAVPYRLERMFIANELPSGAGSLFSGYSRKKIDQSGRLGADLYVSDTTWADPKIILEGLIMRQVGGGAPDLTSGGSEAKVAKRCTELVWKIDPEAFMTVTIGAPETAGISNLEDWLEVECHKSASLRVLVDGRTVTTAILEDLRPFICGTKSYRPLEHLTITAPSDEALELWQTEAASLDTKTALEFLSVESASPPADKKFDLVITRALLHGSHASPNDILKGWGAVLKPRGRLLVLDDGSVPQNTTNGVKHDAHDADVNGNVPVTMHTRQLTLSGLDLTLISAVDEHRPQNGTVYLLTPEPSDAKETDIQFEHLLRSALESIHLVVQSISPSTAGLDFKGQHVISLLDLTPAGFVSRWTAPQFEFFKGLVNTAASLFWVTRGAQMLRPAAQGLTSAPTTGMLRVLRNEFPQITLFHLDLSPAFDIASPGGADLVARSWLSSTDESAGAVPDLEYAELDGHLYVPRTLEVAAFDDEIALATGMAPPTLVSLGSAGPLRWDAKRDIWLPDREADDPLGLDEVEVRVTGLSGLASDGVPPRYAVGVVTRLGSSVSAFAEGDVVAVLGAAACKTHLRSSHVVSLPGALHAAPEAAAIVALLLEASYILKEVVRLVEGNSILIWGGTAPLSQALVWVARRLGARVFTTARTREEKLDCVARLGISEASVLDAAGGALASYMLQKTGGIDVVVAPSAQLAAMTALSTWLADFGHVISLVTEGSTDPLPRLKRQNVSLSTVNPDQLLNSRPDVANKLIKRLLHGSLDALESARVQRLTEFSVSDLAGAAGFAHNQQSDGIIAIRFDQAAQIPVLPAPPPPLRLDASATYVLAGGLGSLGLRIASLMVDHGAGHVVLLSRSGRPGKWEGDIARLRARGCAVDVLKCDVNSAESVDRAAQDIAAAGRKVRGIVQCAMVLQDGVFNNMTHEQWTTAFTPKVAGTWHLHGSFPKDVDFFILLSSVVAVIGNVSQANYAAGNTYMDAFAHWRRSQGLSAVSLNVGLVSDSDHTIDGTSMDGYLDRFSHMASVSTTLDELDIGLLAVMRGSTASDARPVGPQVVFGMTDSLRRDGPVVDQWTLDRKFDHRVVSRKPAAAGPDAGPSAEELLGAAGSLTEAAAVVQGALKQLLAPGLGVQPADIGDDRPLYDVGVDSFKAVEIRNQVFRELKGDISVFEILSSRPLAELALLIAGRSSLVPAEVRATGHEERA